MAKNPHPPGPSAEDAARRLVVLKYVVVYALTSPPRDMLRMLLQRWSADERQKFTADGEAKRDEFWQPLHQAGLWQYVSPAERELAGTTVVTMTAQQQVDASWRVESAQVLMWALGLIPRLPPYDKQASHDVLKQIPCGDIAGFVSSARMRNGSEIDRARADAELWHWRSRTRQLIEEGREFPADKQTRAAGFNSYDDIVRFSVRKLAEEGRISPIDGDFPVQGEAYRNLSADDWSVVRSITVERHFALNWLCGYAPENDWDETPTDT
jgi:Domain of unknown function (DUF4272)